MALDHLSIAVSAINNGGVIAYPTEAVFGLGCDPYNNAAVLRICKLKHRSPNKGMIVIASNWQQLQELVKPITPTRLKEVLLSWPGPITWVFPASDKAPTWICRPDATIALRVTAHPVANKLCRLWQGPLVSTSANIEGEESARDVATVESIFGQQLDYIVNGKVGKLAKPTMIIDAISGKILRN